MRAVDDSVCQSDLAAIIAQRQIGQQALRFDAGALRHKSLDELHALLEWAPAKRALACLYRVAKGEKAWPPLAMFKAMLIATWHDLSDVMPAEALSDPREFSPLLRFCFRQSITKTHGLCALLPLACCARARLQLV